MIINVCAPNKRAPKYINQKLMEVKEKTDISIIITEISNILAFLIIDRTTR